MPLLHLDDCVSAAVDALTEHNVPHPALFFFMGTGLGTLPAGLKNVQRVALKDMPGVPAAWHDCELITAKWQGQDLWLLEDAPAGLETGEEGGDDIPDWARAFPCWLAASYGAAVCVHASAGVALQPAGHEILRAGTLAVLSDHINLSGHTPLVGLGQTRLGPLFPDLTYLYHPGLRHVALERARSQGIELHATIAACTLGPTLDTPAELTFLGQTGAGVAVQGLADPLIACAHAGLALLALVAITDERSDAMGHLHIDELVAAADACAPALEDLIKTLMPDLLLVAEELSEEV
jgi:purine-nucleoside phosphorylase